MRPDHKGLQLNPCKIHKQLKALEGQNYHKKLKRKNRQKWREWWTVGRSPKYAADSPLSNSVINDIFDLTVLWRHYFNARKYKYIMSIYI